VSEHDGDHVLTNITITSATLAKYLPNVSDYLMTDNSQADFEDIELIVKRRVYRDICKKMGYDPIDADGDIKGLIKDHADAGYLIDKLHYLVLSEIMLMNNVLDMAEVYNKKAEALPLDFYIDKDSGGVEETERTQLKTIKFGR
jgi:hypothetical protein